VLLSSSFLGGFTPLRKNKGWRKKIDSSSKINVRKAQTESEEELTLEPVGRWVTKNSPTTCRGEKKCWLSNVSEPPKRRVEKKGATLAIQANLAKEGPQGLLGARWIRNAWVESERRTSRRKRGGEFEKRKDGTAPGGPIWEKLNAAVGRRWEKGW